jgi:predicted ATP-grasp superfamily ATP-dependent carboligase
MSEPGAFTDAVDSLVRRLHVDVVLPVADPAMLALLAARERLAPATVPFPDLAVIRRISDKALLTGIAPELGIRAPGQRVIESRGAVATLGSEPLRFPIVVKPSRSVVEVGSHRLKLGVCHASNAEALEHALDDLPPEAYPVLLQERIIGPGVGIFLLAWEGADYAVFAHRRLREKPPSGGVSVYRESVTADRSLISRSRTLLDRCGWDRGVAMVEYKIDAVTGTPYLMEINGRFWGSLQLAVDAGVDFPALLVTLATGGHPKPVEVYRIGIRSRWWWGDVDHLLARFRRSDDERALAPGSPSRIRALLDFLTLWRPGDRNEVLRVSDPMPFFRETAAWLQGR